MLKVFEPLGARYYVTDMTPSQLIDELNKKASLRFMYIVGVKTVRRETGKIKSDMWPNLGLILTSQILTCPSCGDSKWYSTCFSIRHWRLWRGRSFAK